MKKRITIGTLTLLSLMGMFGCKQQETVEALMTLDVKADYPEKEWVVQDFLDVEYIPLETNDEFITQGSVKAIGKRFVLVTNLLNDGNIFVFDRKTGKASGKSIGRDREPRSMLLSTGSSWMRKKTRCLSIVLRTRRYLSMTCKGISSGVSSMPRARSIWMCSIMTPTI